MASSGMLRSAKIPASGQRTVASRTTNLFFSEKSMIARSMDPYGLWLSDVALGVGDGLSALSLGAGK